MKQQVIQKESSSKVSFFPRIVREFDVRNVSKCEEDRMFEIQKGAEKFLKDGKTGGYQSVDASAKDYLKKPSTSLATSAMRSLEPKLRKDDGEGKKPFNGESI